MAPTFPEIAQLRTGVAAAIQVATDRVYPYVPDDVAELPCCVVGPLDMTRNAQVGGWSVTLPIVCIGRRINTFDAQAELEEFMWDVVEALTTTNPANVPGLRPTVVSPDIQNVAGEEMPTYVITVAVEAVYC